MSKEEKDNVFKINVPIFTNEELRRLDDMIENDIDNIINQISKTVSKDREVIFLKKVIDKLQKENKKYIDIFNSTEKIMNGQERTKDKLLKENVELQKDNYKLDRENQHFFDRIQDLQKQLDQLKEVDRQICNEELITKDKYQNILKENAELKEQRDNAIKLRNELIEEQKITCISKNKIRDKIKELTGEIHRTKKGRIILKDIKRLAKIEVLKELLVE